MTASGIGRPVGDQRAEISEHLVIVGMDVPGDERAAPDVSGNAEPVPASLAVCREVQDRRLLVVRERAVGDPVPVKVEDPLPVGDALDTGVERVQHVKAAGKVLLVSVDKTHGGLDTLVKDDLALLLPDTVAVHEISVGRHTVAEHAAVIQLETAHAAFLDPARRVCRNRRHKKGERKEQRPRGPP